MQYVSKADIQELKAIAKPPHAVANTMCAVAMLMGREPSWKSAKCLLGNPSMLCTAIHDFDKDQIQPDTLAKLEPYVRELKASEVKKSSAAAEGLCRWVLDVCGQCGQRDHETTSTASTCSDTQSWTLTSPTHSEARSESELTLGDDIKVSPLRCEAEQVF